MKILVVLLVSLALLGAVANAQELKEMEWEEMDAMNIIYPNPDNTSILLVESTVMNLRFGSNRGGIISSRYRSDLSVYEVKLEVGTHIITIKADGYLNLQLPRYNYKTKPPRKIRVRSKLRFGAASGFDENRPTLNVHYTPSKRDEEVYITLNTNPPQKMDFSSGVVMLRPSVGQNTIKVYASGRSWETSIFMEAKQIYKAVVDFSAGQREELTEMFPGNLYVVSEPPGAEVLLNQVKQEGVTPMTINDIRPGDYEIEILKDLYLSERRIAAVRSNAYETVNVKLIPNFGEVRVNTNPTGALVYINGQQRGVTPISIPRINAGRYTLRLVQQLYHEVLDTFAIEPGGGFDQDYALRPQFGKLKVTSEPSGAAVEVDGVSWGTTPIERDQVFSGSHIVHLSKENVFPREKEVIMTDGAEMVEHFDLTASVGRLTVVSEPTGAIVTLAKQNRDLGVTPLQNVPVEPGTYLVRVEKDNYEIYEEAVPITLGSSRAINANLVRKTGHIRVESQPFGAVVFLDGERHGTTPTVLQNVPIGVHVIRLEKDGFDIQIADVVVTHRQTSAEKITLGTSGTKEWSVRRKRARIKSLFLIGQWGEPSQQTRAAIYGVGFVGSLCMAFNANQQWNDENDRYTESWSKYQSAITQTEMNEHFYEASDAVNAMEDADMQKNIFLATAAGIYLIQIADAWFFGGGSKPVSRGAGYGDNGGFVPFVSVQNDKSHVGFNVCFDITKLLK